MPVQVGARHGWGVCALPGGHAADGWVKCAHHDPAPDACMCGGRAPHHPAALGCSHGCRPEQQRAHVWPALPCSVPPMRPEFGAPAEADWTVSDFYGLPTTPLIIGDAELKLHVRAPDPTLPSSLPIAHPARTCSNVAHFLRALSFPPLPATLVAKVLTLCVSEG